MDAFFETDKRTINISTRLEMADIVTYTFIYLPIKSYLFTTKSTTQATMMYKEKKVQLKE